MRLAGTRLWGEAGFDNPWSREKPPHCLFPNNIEFCGENVELFSAHSKYIFWNAFEKDFTYRLITEICWDLICVSFREGFQKTKWKFKMDFSMKGVGGLEFNIRILKNDYF